MEDNIAPGWRTSSYTGNGGGNCVEVGEAAHMIIVRDTKDRSGPVLQFSPAAWHGFAGQVKRARSVRSTRWCVEGRSRTESVSFDVSGCSPASGADVVLGS